MQQSFRWPAPVFIGDVVTVTATVTQKSEGTRTLSLKMEATNQNGSVVLQGEGKVVLLEKRKETGSTPLSEQVALVTGASRGIGAAIASALSAVGVRVAVNYKENAAEAARVCEAIQNAEEYLQDDQGDSDNKAKSTGDHAHKGKGSSAVLRRILVSFFLEFTSSTAGLICSSPRPDTRTLVTPLRPVGDKRFTATMAASRIFGSVRRDAISSLAARSSCAMSI